MFRKKKTWPSSFICFQLNYLIRNLKCSYRVFICFLFEIELCNFRTCKFVCKLKCAYYSNRWIYGNSVFIRTENLFGHVLEGSVKKIFSWDALRLFWMVLVSPLICSTVSPKMFLWRLKCVCDEVFSSFGFYVCVRKITHAGCVRKIHVNLVKFEWWQIGIIVRKSVILPIIGYWNINFSNYIKVFFSHNGD